jgi:recombination protein RecR
MYYYYPESVARLIEALGKLPGVGPKSAQRLAFFLLDAKEEDALGLADAIAVARSSVRKCGVCANLTDDEICPVCRDSRRDESVICVVEQPRDVVSMEKTHEFNGRYHVLHGAISPMEGRGPEQLTVGLLLKRLQDGKVKEVVMATNPNVEGDATALYLPGY